MADEVERSVAIIRGHIGGFNPWAAIVLGSGLGAFANAVASPVTVSYDELPGFPRPAVRSHEGRLVIGHLGNACVAIMQGRAHYYESSEPAAMKIPLQVLRAIGCRILILTNSAGSLRPDAGPGSLMMITDHINFGGINPLLGERGDDPFVDMTEAYDPEIRAGLAATARKLAIVLHEGVYIWFSGPSFETPAEIRAARMLGADAVGMSTVPEVLLGRWLGFRVAAVSVIANAAAGTGEKRLTHDMSVARAEESAQDLTRLLTGYLAASRFR